MDMITAIAPDRETISPTALTAFLAAIAAPRPAQAVAAVAQAAGELERIVAAEGTARARLEEISRELHKQPARSADDLAAALIAGSRLTDQTTSRPALEAEQSKLREAMGSLARQRTEAQRKIEQAKVAARRPYAIEAANLIEDIRETARDHIAGLVACYAAAETLSRTADLRGSGPMISGLRDMLDRAQQGGAELLMANHAGADAPADVQAAIAALADLGEPFGFQPVTRIPRV